MTLVHATERDDFKSIVVKLGFLLVDFEIYETRDIPANREIYAVTGKIHVKRKSTGIARGYSAGHGSAWLPQFELELLQGAFGAV